MTSEAREEVRVEKDATAVPREQGFQVWELLENGAQKLVEELFITTSADLRFINGDKEKGLDQKLHFVLRPNTQYKLQLSAEVAETFLKRSCGSRKVDDDLLKNQVEVLIAQGKSIESADFARVLLAGCDLCKADLTKADLSSVCLCWTDLSDAKLEQTVLCKADLSGAILAQANLNNANLQKANLIEANLESANLNNANLQKANLYNAILTSANLMEANLESANLYNANLQKANLYNAILTSANLMDANLESADMRGANLESANLYSANLQKAYFCYANLTSASLYNANLQKVDFFGANLTSADMGGANLETADMREANLTSADMRRANLESAKMREANLTSADLRRANLTSAKLQNVNWMGAKIEYADLTDSNMDHGEQLDTVDFENVRFSEQTSLDDTDLGRFTVSSKRLALPPDNSLYQAIFKHTAQKLFEEQVEGVDGDDDAEDGSDDGDDDDCDAIDEDVVAELLDVDPKKFGEAMLDRFAENIFKVLGDVLLRFLHDDTFAKTIVFEKMDGNAKPFTSWMITQLKKRGQVALAQDHENVPDGLRTLWEQTFQAPEECDAEDRPPSCPDRKLASALLAELLCAEEQAVQQLEEWIETQLNSPKPSAVRTLLVKLLCSDNEAVRTKVQQLIEQQVLKKPAIWTCEAFPHVKEEDILLLFESGCTENAKLEKEAKDIVRSFFDNEREGEAGSALRALLTASKHLQDGFQEAITCSAESIYQQQFDKGMKFVQELMQPRVSLEQAELPQNQAELPQKQAEVTPEHVNTVKLQRRMSRIMKVARTSLQHPMDLKNAAEVENQTRSLRWPLLFRWLCRSRVSPSPSDTGSTAQRHGRLSGKELERAESRRDKQKLMTKMAAKFKSQQRLMNEWVDSFASEHLPPYMVESVSQAAEGVKLGATKKWLRMATDYDWGSTWSLVNKTIKISPLQLVRHLKELEYLAERLDKVETPIKRDTWEDSVQAWIALSELLPVLQVQRGQQVLEAIFADEDVLKALETGNKFLKSTGAVPQVVIATLKTQLVNHMQSNMYMYKQSIQHEQANICRVQDMQTRGVALIGTIFAAALIGVANFLSRLAYVHFYDDVF